MRSFFVATLILAGWLATASSSMAGIVLAGGLFSGRIDRWDTTNNTVSTFSDIGGATGSFVGVVGMAYNPVSNRVLVAGRFVNTIYELDATSGSIVGVHDMAGLDQPAGIAVDSAGNIYVANNGGNTITRFNSDFSTQTTITMPNFGVGDNLPSGLAFNSSGELYIATFAGVGVVKYDPASGDFSSFNSVNPVANGLATVDGQGNLFVGGAAFSNAVTKFDTTGAIVGNIVIDSTLLPEPAQSFTSPNFTSPSGVAIDGDGNLVVGALGRTNPTSSTDNFQNNGGLFLFDPAGNLIISTVQTTPYASVLYFTAVPEPTSLLALGVGLSGIAIARRFRRRANSSTKAPSTT